MNNQTIKNNTNEKKKIYCKYCIKKSLYKISCLLILKDGRLAVSFISKTPTINPKDSFIKVYDLKTYQISLSLNGHTKSVSCITQIETKRLLSSSYDHTIKIWKISKMFYQCEATIHSHIDKVQQVLPISNQKFASSSLDSTIKIWSTIYPHDCLFSIELFDQPVEYFIVLKNRNCLVSPFIERKIAFWYLPFNGEVFSVKKMKIPSRCNRLYQLEDSNFIFSAGINELYVISPNTMQIVSIIQMEKMEIIFSFCKYNNNTILIGNVKGDLFSINIPSLVVELLRKKAHNDKIESIIEMKANSFITGSDDYEIRIWELGK